MTVAYEADQLVLYSEPRAQHNAPDTSRAAAETVKPGHQNRLQRIADIVHEAGPWGATADEIWAHACQQDEKKHTRSTWHGAVAAAAKAGLIVPRGRLHVRLSIHNSAMQIYVSPEEMGKL